MQLAKSFFDAALHRLNFADFKRAFFVVLDERNVRLVVDDVLDLLDVVAVAKQVDFGFGLGKEGVRNTFLHHLVEHGHQGITGDGIRAERLDGGNGKPLLQLVVDARRFLDFFLHGGASVIFAAADDCLHLAVLFELFEVLF